MRPLEGVRILAFTQYAAGPFGTMMLADLGAEVVNIESPDGGDMARYVPPFSQDGDSLFYQAFNRNKKSLVLNLRKPEGQALFHRLVEGADAVLNNLRGDQPSRLGLDYAALQSINPRIVCCSCSGFGASGPRVKEPCFDYLIQARLGIMDLTGEPDGPPSRAGVSFVDFSTGVMGALGTMIGIWQAARTGKGCDVETSLFETGLSYLNYLASWWLNEEMVVTRLKDSAHPTVAPSQRFVTKDGYLMVMAQTEKFWQLLCRLLDRHDLLTEPRFVDAEARYEHREEIKGIFQAIFAERTTEQWLALLENQVPCAPVQTLREGLADPQVAARQMLIEYDHPRWGRLKATGTPLKVSTMQPLDHRAAPGLGADREQVLGEWLGLSPAEIERLAEAFTP